ncbi:GCN5-like N-acetyltransferase [Pseudomonas sp. M47T1]|uniref:GNAT family N-acetyltransferase n=1 Tax=unclassified Pseudomonas TaxID=196821 RepID=UPI000260686B|nr:GNAT family N-acetyltransferase [Pseudomonas sp. M47T1]EIK94915.1 GCN5-like N-acetyltransferase [Pseudomonas sp. M47T1]
MDPLIAIQPPASGDAGIVSRILERSIRGGCALDHRNNPCVVEAWLRNKRCDDVSRWLADDALYLRLGWLEGKPVGVALALASGEICLCYVQPESFRRGVGRALMAAMEAILRRQGHHRAMLYSTRTACAFHEHLGYRQTGRPMRLSGLLLVPMDKLLGKSDEVCADGLVKRA